MTMKNPLQCMRRRRFWVLNFLGFCLSLNAGYINAISLIDVIPYSVTHVTGTITRIATTLAAEAHYNPHYSSQLFGVVFSFFLGSAISSIITSSIILKPDNGQEHQSVHAQRVFTVHKRYTWIFWLASVFLVASYLLSKAVSWWGECFASFTAGALNSLSTTFSGGVIRTTHMTGCTTDLGILLGEILVAYTYRAFHGKDVHVPNISWWKLTILSTLLIGFFGGGLLGGLAYNYLNQEAMLASAGFMAFLGILTLISKVLQWDQILLEDHRDDRDDTASILSTKQMPSISLDHIHSSRDSQDTVYDVEMQKVSPFNKVDV